MLDNDVLSPHEIYFRLVQYDLDWHFLTTNTDKIKLYFYVIHNTITESDGSTHSECWISLMNVMCIQSQSNDVCNVNCVICCYYHFIIYYNKVNWDCKIKPVSKTYTGFTQR